MWLDRGAPALTGPCGPAAWYLEVRREDDPLGVVAAAVHRVVGEPLVVHSTSWRRDRDSVVLSFVAVLEPDQVGAMESVPLSRAELARGSATSAPATVGHAQVVQHGLRHLSWLLRDDPAVAARLEGAWAEVLGGYVPEPFRHLGG